MIYKAFTVVVLIGALFFLRLQAVINPRRPRLRERGRRDPSKTAHLMVVLGSGGHTAEMIAMLERAVQEQDGGTKLEWSGFSHRTWVVSAGDFLSAERARQFEDMVAGVSGDASGTYQVNIVPRAREIHQPLHTAPRSSLRCLFACLGVLIPYAPQEGAIKVDFPDVILCNGPATATVLVFTSILLRFFNVRGCNSRGKMRTIYVESFARVRRLSLSGKLLVHLVDRFLVQWPQLERVGGRVEYVGMLV